MSILNIPLHYAVYLIAVLAIIFLYLWRFRKKDRRNTNELENARAAGLTQPASLHPIINPAKCLGSGVCATACPEGNVIGIIKRKAQLINATNCIGHGACKTACPHDAITLVFGTAERGVDIPEVSPSFETNIPGMFIAGELGGMGLISNAIEQGRQAMESIKKRKGKASKDQLDVLVVGAGPAGFSASLSALQYNMKFKTIEQETLGGTVSNFPRGKLVMTQPVILPTMGKVKFRETTKEKLMDFWHVVEQKSGIKINYRERMEDISRNGKGFVVKTTKGTYHTRNVLLTIGRRGTPRKLGVPGEELPKVVYRLMDPAEYQGKHVLVVGGGDAALEAAVTISEEPGTKVTISYRSDAFGRAKEKNRKKVEQAERSGKLKVLFSSTTKEIYKNKVTLAQGDKLIELQNDGVIVSAGGILPTPFLKKIGINVETKYGTA